MNLKLHLQNITTKNKQIKLVKQLISNLNIIELDKLINVDLSYTM